jgi:hypothetical protein
MDEGQQEVASLVTLWRTVIRGDRKSRVTFELGTCLLA